MTGRPGFYVSLILHSRNAKTGSMPVSTSSSHTCPKGCRLMGGGCYAEHGPLLMHWRRLNCGLGALRWSEFLEAVRHLPPGQIWRYGQAGDLPGIGGRINGRLLMELVEANYGRRGYAYTHKPLSSGNSRLIRRANDLGFTINVSADCPAQADDFVEKEVGPVVTLVPRSCGKEDLERLWTPAGRRIVLCKAQVGDTNCLACGLCALVLRKPIIGFLPHGSRARSADRLAGGGTGFPGRKGKR